MPQPTTPTLASSGELSRDVALAVRLTRDCWKAVLPRVLVASLLWALISDPGLHVQGWLWPVGFAGFVWAEVRAMRAFALSLGADPERPRRDAFYCAWAIIVTLWPALAATFVDSFLLRIGYAVLGPFAPQVHSVWTLVALSPVFFAFVVQAWAFSYVAVEGMAAPAATNGVLWALLDAKTLVRWVVLTLLLVVVGTAIWLGIEQPVMVHLPGRLSSAVLAVFVDPVQYALLFAVLFTTRPALDAQRPATPKRQRATPKREPANVSPASQASAQPAVGKRRRKRRSRRAG